MKHIIVFLILFFGLIISCNINDISGTNNDEPTAYMELSISLAKAPVEIISMSGFLSRSGEDTIKFDFTIQNNNAYCKVQEIKPGDWELTVNAYNANYELAYSGSTKVIIKPGKVTTVYLHLDPSTGSLRIIVTWGDTDLSHGLVAYYPFNGNATDESGNENNGIVYGSSLSEDRFGFPNCAYSFNGIDNYIKILSNFSLKQVTISVWIKPSVLPQEGSIIFKTVDYYNDWGLFFRDSLHILDDINNNNKQIYKNEISLDWHFIVATIDSDKQNLLYIDGTLVGSGDYSLGNWNSFNGFLYIGQRGTDRYNGYFDGKIDDIRIYNRVLTDEEINSLYYESE